MVDRVFMVRKVVVLVALAGAGLQVLPDLAGVAAHVVRWGPGGLGFADLAADCALLVAVALAAAGVVRRRSWGRWVGRGVGLLVLGRVGASAAVFGSLRPLELPLLLAAALLLVSLPGPEAEYVGGPAQEREGLWRRGLGGWTLAAAVAVVPALLGSADQTVADAVGATLAVLWLLSAALAALAAAGAGLLIAGRPAGLLACAAAAVAALALYRGVVVPDPLVGHPELVLLLPATAVACAAAIAARPDLAALARRSPRPIL